MIDCIRTSLSTQSSVRSTFWRYGYDNANRLTSLSHVKTPTTIESLTYIYDAAGNRTQLTRANAAATLLPTAIASTNLAYDAANEQVRFNSATTNLSYDSNGNLTSFTDGGGTTTYTWNIRNQLTAISGPSLSASFAYDGLGRRSSKTVNGTTTGFWYDGADVLAELSGSTPTATFIRSLSIDEPFIRKLSGSDEFYQTDALGTTAVITDGTGASSTTYTQEPFGKTTKSGTSTNSFQFTGREEDGTGLYYYRARYYSPQMQRFLREDPLGFAGGDANLYGYVFNTPLVYVDPSGLEVFYGGYQVSDPRLRAKLEFLSDAIGEDIYVTGGDRDPKTNEAVGGSRGSKHLTGEAVDFHFALMTDLQGARLAAESGLFNGVGYYPEGSPLGPHIHVDLRDDGSMPRFRHDKNEKGKWVYKKWYSSTSPLPLQALPGKSIKSDISGRK